MSSRNSAVILSFDVELWSETQWLLPYITDSPQIDNSFERSIHSLLKVLDKGSHHATFFVTLLVTQHYPHLIKTIASKGHEIGIHGPRHIRLHDYTPEDFRRDCILQIQLITDITGIKPRGFRAAHFSLNQKTMWVIPILKELGFVYDSSIFPMNMGEYGVSNSSLDNHEIIPGFTEIPMTVATFGNVRIPFAGGIYFRLLPLRVFLWLTNNVSRYRIPMMYFHPHELEATTPRITRGPWFRRTLKYWGVNKSFSKFEKVLNWYIFDSIERKYFTKR